jgi:hypothetical protein
VEQRKSFDQILAELKASPMTAWILEVIKPNEMYIPKAIESLLNLSKDMVNRQIVHKYKGIAGNWNADGTYCSSIRIPGVAVLVWYYENQVNR